MRYGNVLEFAMDTKKCTKCGEEKSLSDFHRRSANLDGRSSHCKVCRAKHYTGDEGVRDRWVKYYIENADRFRAQKIKCRKENPGKAREDDARYRGRYPERVKARRAVSHAIMAGRLVRQNGCSMCPSVTMPEAHHEDYSKPLEVAWLCKECHRAADRLMRLEEERKKNESKGGKEK